MQAYNYRLCTTDAPENRRDWPKPAGYNPLDYELLLRNFEAGDNRVPWNPIWMPNRKTDTNNNFAISTDFIGASYDYPEADYATRERIITAHRDYQLGLMWTLANDARVPEKVGRQFRRLGLAKDEFTDNDNWPQQLYVRESRRMVSEYVMTEHNCRGHRAAEDSVGLAAYTMDSHNVQRYVDAQGHARNEGDVQVGGFPPYPISYRSIVRRRPRSVRTSWCPSAFRPLISRTVRFAWSRCSWCWANRRPQRPCRRSRRTAACRRSTTLRFGSGLRDDKQILAWPTSR